MPLSQIRRGVHLLPQYGAQAPREWTSSNVLVMCTLLVGLAPRVRILASFGRGAPAVSPDVEPDPAAGEGECSKSERYSDHERLPVDFTET